ncbi:hypothetical protein CK203_045120 [Vitis vinifera]|uniref:DUF4283 domain-containing protein n=1 Tax=Vitis vinifera TaxID=29760 RepID=A0A438HD45_VITVI|nr:hypothetical protein CK203_045120 [Vitis vinifera]
MAEMLQKVVGSNGGKEKKQEDRAMVKTSMNKSFAEMVKGSEGRGGEVVRVEVKEEEIRGNLRKLEHCLVGSWSPSLANGMDMERFGWLMARTWGLQGKLGLARMEMGRFLLEFQYVGEADRPCLWKQAGGRRPVGLERWRPRCGCEDEGGSRKEVWVKILGLPVSYGFRPFCGNEAGDEEGDFWKSSKGNYREEVRGDAAARATPRVGEVESARPEALLLAADGTDGQVRGEDGMGLACGPEQGMGPGFLRIRISPSQPESRKGKLERGSIWTRADFSEGRNREVEFLKIREKEDSWKQQMALSHSVTDRALIEEESRYGSGEYYDHSGVACEEIQNEIPLNTIKPVENGGGRWDLVEDITVNNNDKEWERGSMLDKGLEKEILNFLAKIRKRREKIYSRGVLEKTKFERELKRLECSINYEGGSKQRSSFQEAFWSVGIKVVELLEWEEGQFTISCRFRKVEDGADWVFTGVYGPFTKNERDCMWDEIGAIRGLWEEPWCCDSKKTVQASFDHFPVVLEGGTVRRGNRGERSASFRLATKMKAVKQKLKVWNREVFGRLEDNKAAALQLVDTGTGWKHSRVMVKGRGQQYRILPSYGGCHRRFNHMDRIKIGGVWLTEEKDVREGVLMLSTFTYGKFRLEGGYRRLQLEQLNQQEAENLEHLF